MPVHPLTQPARSWRRLLAFLVDMAILMPLLLVLGRIWIALFDIALPSRRLPFYDYLVQLHLQGDPLVIGGGLVIGLVIASYFLISQLLWGTTVGMRALGLSLVNTQGARPGAGAVAARVMGAGLSTAYFLLGFIWIVFDSQGQGLHDKIAGTRVIRRNAR